MTDVVMTGKDLAKMVEEKAGVTFDKVVTSVVWFNSPGGQRTVLNIAKPMPLPPGDDKTTILGIFSDDDVIRVYVVSTGESKQPPRCFELDKRTPIYSVIDISPISTFIDMLANEWSEFCGGESTAESEREAIVEYLESLPPEVSMATAIEAIKNGDHFEDEDDEAEGDKPAEAPASVAASSLPPVVGTPLPGKP